MKETVIFVHGFGVMKDARGMFTEIAETLSAKGYNCILIDLNLLDSAGNIIVNPFSKQVEILRKVYSQHTQNQVSLICHSQGCVIAALADLPNIRKTIFLAPPVDDNAAKTINYFSKNPLTTINVNGLSKLARRDGTFTIVPPEYWKERAQFDLKEIYKTYISKNSVFVVKALLDEVISNQETNDVFVGCVIKELEANHDFTGTARTSLTSLCREILHA